MAKLLADFKLAYDCGEERRDALRKLHAVILNNKGCIIKIEYHLDYVYHIRPGVYYIRPGKCLLQYNDSELDIQSRGMVSITDYNVAPDINRWSHYYLDASKTYRVQVYDRLPKKELDMVKRNYRFPIDEYEQKIRVLNRELKKSMTILEK